VADEPDVEANWLDNAELAAWVRLVALMELLPGAVDSQLRRDAALTHFEYQVLAILSDAPERTLRMTVLAAHANATLPRLSHVVSRLEERGFAERFPCPEDGRATNARLTAQGRQKISEAAPGHVAAVRRYVISALTGEQVARLTEITEAVLRKLDPEGTKTTFYRRYG
jgi:DNA-binding MarR family transcriptional regulator